MNAPLASLVRPRALSPSTGESMLLEDLIASHLAAGDTGFILIEGGPLTGKTTAIRYLDHVFRDTRGLELYDEHVMPRELSCVSGRLKVATSATYKQRIATYSLARWERDECIEYLLANHKSQCASVMRRIESDTGRDYLQGNPFLWSRVLEEMAGNESATTCQDTLKQIVDRAFPPSVVNVVRRFALLCVSSFFDKSNPVVEQMAQCKISSTGASLLCLEPVRMMLAVDGFMDGLRTESAVNVLSKHWSIDLIRRAGARVRLDSQLQDKLRRMLEPKTLNTHGTAASLLHAADIGWRPDLTSEKQFAWAYLAGSNWTGMNLQWANLMGADLTGSILTNCTLAGCLLTDAKLTRANLHGAFMANTRAKRADFNAADLSFIRASGINLGEANLTGANLEGSLLSDAMFTNANLTNASFVRANLTRAFFYGSDIRGADFGQANLDDAHLAELDLREANFDHAIFTGANLAGCNLEGMELPGANFSGARFRGALMTGSIMSHARFFGADLQETGLSDIEWEDVDLRKADLRNVSFHMGSTRSGLVGSPYPSHGTRTGFYTDDLNDQDFKAPEEIRHANLRGADLRGANITDVDFYLVDLRDALYDEEQEQHLRRCGAILEHRVI